MHLPLWGGKCVRLNKVRAHPSLLKILQQLSPLDRIKAKVLIMIEMDVYDLLFILPHFPPLPILLWLYPLPTHPAPTTYVIELLCLLLSMSKMFFLLISHNSLNLHLFKYDIIIKILPNLPIHHCEDISPSTPRLIFLHSALLVSNWCNIKFVCLLFVFSQRNVYLIKAFLILDLLLYCRS